MNVAIVSASYRGFAPLLALALALAGVACTPAAPAPTAPPPKAAPTAAPPPTSAPAAKPAPTTPPAALAPTAKPAATTAPAAKPAPQVDSKAIEDFYKGKTVRILVGFGAGGPYDIFSRIVAKHLPQYLPGKPTVIVENKPGAGSMLAANLVYTTEAKDGTVIGNWAANMPLLQVMGKDGVQFDAAKLNWLGSGAKTVSVCSARADSGIKSIQDIMGPGGKELITGAIAPGSSNYDVPATMNAALGTRFKLVPGYDSTAKIGLALENNEVQGYCSNLDSLTTSLRSMFEGDKASLWLFASLGGQASTHPWLKGVSAVEPLAKSDETRQMLEAVNIPALANLPYAIAPEVPKERVEALRKAMAETFAAPQFRAEAEKAGFDVNPNSADELTRVYQQVLKTPAATVEKLKAVLK